jgi:hypothetical protein
MRCLFCRNDLVYYLWQSQCDAGEKQNMNASGDSVAVMKSSCVFRK